jgi:hypothetical protein
MLVISKLDDLAACPARLDYEHRTLSDVIPAIRGVAGAFMSKNMTATTANRHYPTLLWDTQGRRSRF